MSQAGANSSSGGGGGNVTGPSSSVAGDIAIFSDTTGKVIADSGVNISSLGLIQVATITLTSLQIKSLRATPIAFVPAAGANTVFVPVAAQANFTYGGTSAFNQSGPISICFGSASAPFCLQGVVSAINIALTYDFICASTFLPLSNSFDFVASDLINQPLIVKNTGGVEITGNAENNNTIQIVFLYYVTTYT
jgi:hypothetical protein